MNVIISILVSKCISNVNDTSQPGTIVHTTCPNTDICKLSNMLYIILLNQNRNSGMVIVDNTYLVKGQGVVSS